MLNRKKLHVVKIQPTNSKQTNDSSAIQVFSAKIFKLKQVTGSWKSVLNARKQKKNWLVFRKIVNFEIQRKKLLQVIEQFLIDKKHKLRKQDQ